MVNSMVERATSDMLIGPDWAMNLEICDICNHDPAQAKDVIRGIKKRLGSKNSKVQLLALTLLETIVKNCGDIVHMHVAEKDLPREMVKIVKKKPDLHVKDKVLVLIDTWQEAFGGPRSRYPQYYVAFQDLLRHGAVFPQRSEGTAPVFTLPQTHPLSAYPPNLRNLESRPDAIESSAEAELPTLSLAELQNARGIMDVLAEMLNALGPGNKEGLKQEVIVDLVEQCRNYKPRVVHLINSTSDESILSQGLALNDDLQRVLAKHDSIASGAPSLEVEKPNTEPAQPETQVTMASLLVDTGGGKNSDNRPTSSTSLGKQLPFLSPPTTSGQSTTPTKADPKIDLLSGDDFNSPAANSLALVPVGQPQQTSPVSSQQNTLALIDMFTDNKPGQASPPTQFQPHTDFNLQQPSLHQNGSISGPMLQQHEPQLSAPVNSRPPSWNGQIMPQQQPPSPVHGVDNGCSLPPPPWETQLDSYLPTANQSPEIQIPQGVIAPPQPSSGSAYLPVTHTAIHQSAQINQHIGLHPHPVQSSYPAMVMYPQAMQYGSAAYVYPQQQMYGNHISGFGYGTSYGNSYGYGQPQPQNTQFLQQGMSGLSMRDNSGLRNASSLYASTPAKPSRPEDKLFGDLVDISKFKPAKPASSKTGST